MTAGYLLDTNVCIDFLRAEAPAALSLKRAALELSAISSVTLAELEVGAAKSERPAEHRQRVEEFLVYVTVLDFDAAAARHYGEIRVHLERKGTPIGPLDTLIAAHARSLGATLVTANLNEFKRVPGLKCVAWERQ
ncbi:MAG: type II toxin-antitoxin system VapC family toxin [Verrucomicrobiia bacterium]|jgi:tRNA(fMet)-specific endonuclease VapC